MKKINTPASLDEVRKLKAGDVVNISGIIFTARDQAHKRIIEKQAPFDINGAAIFHAGPIIKENDNNGSDSSNSKFQMVAIGPTTSTRMNQYTPDVIEMGTKIIIGKGGMDDAVATSLKNDGAVYLVAVGGCAALYVDSIKKINDVHWLDLGIPEAIWELEVDNFGPLIVAMDSHGNSLFK